QPLFNMTIGPGTGDDSQNQLALTDLSLLGVNLSSVVNAIVSGHQVDDIDVELSEDPPVKIQGSLSGATDPFQITQSLELAGGLGQLHHGLEGAFALGSTDLYLPDPVLSSSSQQANGVVTDSQKGKIADVKLQMGPLL